MSDLLNAVVVIAAWEFSGWCWDRTAKWLDARKGWTVKIVGPRGTVTVTSSKRVTPELIASMRRIVGAEDGAA